MNKRLLGSQHVIPQLHADLLLLTFVFPYEGFFAQKMPLPSSSYRIMAMTFYIFKETDLT